MARAASPILSCIHFHTQLETGHILTQGDLSKMIEEFGNYSG